MQTPKKVSPNKFAELIRNYFSKRVIASHCAMCGGPIRFASAYISKHDARFDSAGTFACTGRGQVEIVPIPFCRNCEDLPDEYGCVHLEDDSSLAEHAYAGIMAMPKKH